MENKDAIPSIQPEPELKHLRGISNQSIQYIFKEEIKETLQSESDSMRALLETLIGNPDNVDVAGYYVKDDQGNTAFRIKKVTVYATDGKMMYFKDLDVSLPKSTLSLLEEMDQTDAN